MSEAARLLRHLRAGSRRRAGWLLDISTDLGVPVVAALSFDGDGSGFACGLGAAWTQVGAVRKALLELGQMESPSNSRCTSNGLLKPRSTKSSCSTWRVQPTSTPIPAGWFNREVSLGPKMALAAQTMALTP